MAMKVPTRSDHARSPPLGFVTIYEFNLRAGLRFPPSPELIDVLTIYGVSLAQLSYKAISIIMELINDWNLLKKWKKLKELHSPLHIGAENLLKILKLSDIDAFYYEVRYLSRYIDEEHLFKVGLSTQAGRSHAQMLKKSVKVSEVVTQPSKVLSKRPGSEDDLQVSKKKKDNMQEAHNHIYDVEVKALEADCIEEGFIRGFMKGVHVVQCKTGAEIEGLTPS
ncbi:hypothetical protein IEQ34_022989 [Dendrobium chrysotoxum]|uniref:Uncharacterized protein n=1 Tax=Dendrobium chrysotoxum TaxID=161865 RepID=A0AAV7FKD2_DENCH|nr:hypothetical protein IEQ34_022989 [Dendrobium chrysotoxum]